VIKAITNLRLDKTSRAMRMSLPSDPYSATNTADRGQKSSQFVFIRVNSWQKLSSKLKAQGSKCIRNP